MKTFTLTGADGTTYESATPGQLGGRRYTGGPGTKGVYGRLDCSRALWAIARGTTYKANQVFFADEATALAAGFRPCGNCLRSSYRIWKAGQTTAA